MKLGMVGLFFNSVIPGSIGGDFVKIAYVSQHTRTRRVEAALTILMDRITGLFGLFVVAAFSCILCFRFLGQASLTLRGLVAFVAFACVIGTCSISVVVWREKLQSITIVNGVILFFHRVLPDKVNSIFSRSVKAIDLYRKSWKVVLIAVLISMVAHCFNTMTLYSLASAIDERNAGIEHHFLAIQVGNCVGAALPLPNGVGGRDLIVQAFLESAGVDKKTAGILPINYTFIMTFWSLCGAFFFTFGRFRNELIDEVTNESV